MEDHFKQTKLMSPVTCHMSPALPCLLSKLCHPSQSSLPRSAGETQTCAIFLMTWGSAPVRHNALTSCYHSGAAGTQKYIFPFLPFCIQQRKHFYLILVSARKFLCWLHIVKKEVIFSLCQQVVKYIDILNKRMTAVHIKLIIINECLKTKSSNLN